MSYSVDRETKIKQKKLSSDNAETILLSLLWAVNISLVKELVLCK